jgi:hypothetical protein
MSLDFAGFPRCVADCGRLLLAHEATTGYKVLQLCVGTSLSRCYGPDGGYVVKEKDRPIVAFLGDGRIRISTNGLHYLGLTARINACLPPGYEMRRARGRHPIGFELRRGKQVIAQFATSTVFTPEAAEPALEKCA